MPILSHPLVRFTCLVLCNSFPALAGAAVILDSGLNGTSNSNVNVVNGKAVGFSLGTAEELGGSSYQLDSVTVRLTTGSSLPNSSQYSFSLYGNDSATSPGTLLATFNPLSLTASSTENYTLILNSPFILQPSTTYWIVATGSLASSNPASFIWKYTGSTATMAPGISLPSPGSYFGADNPSDWTSTSAAYSDIQVNATLIPEASSSLMILTATSLASLRRRRH